MLSSAEQAALLQAKPSRRPRPASRVTRCLAAAPASPAEALAAHKQACAGGALKPATKHPLKQANLMSMMAKRNTAPQQQARAAPAPMAAEEVVVVE